MRQYSRPRGTTWGGPHIPPHLMRDFESITTTKEFDQDSGGVFKTTETRKETISAALLPVDNEDLKFLPEGTKTEDTRKLYTNGEKITVGQKVTDSSDNQTYKVITELTHNGIHPLKRYLVSKEGAAASD